MPPTDGQHLDIEDTYDDLEEGESLSQEYTDEVVQVAPWLSDRLKMSFPVLCKSCFYGVSSQRPEWQTENLRAYRRPFRGLVSHGAAHLRA